MNDQYQTKICSNCGEILENLNYEAIKKCPKCGIDLLQTVAYTIPKTSIVDQLPQKSLGTATLIAFIGGIFGLPGIGHIYWKGWKRNQNTNCWYHHCCFACYYDNDGNNVTNDDDGPKPDVFNYFTIYLRHFIFGIMDMANI